MTTLAPQWRVRCPHCGRHKPFDKVGFRKGAASVGKKILAWCRDCKALRWAIVERDPDAPDYGHLASRLDRLHETLRDMGARMIEEKQGRQRWDVDGEEVVVLFDGKHVDVEGPEALVREIVTAGRGLAEPPRGSER